MSAYPEIGAWAGADLPVGTVTLAATYSGDSQNGTSVLKFTQTVTPSTTITSLTTSPGNYAAQNAPVLLTARVLGSDPTGTVTFYSGSTVLGSAMLSGGFGAITVSSLPAGLDSLTAVYSGDASNGGSTSTAVTEEVLAAPVYVTLTRSSQGVTQGDTLTLTARVTGNQPTGQVTFVSGTTVLGSAALVNGVTTLTINRVNLPAGTDSIVAVYAGDANNATTSSAAVLEQVTAGVVTTTVARDPTDRTATTVYDKDGRVRAVVDGEGYLTETRYDATGRPVETIRYAQKVPGFTDAASIAGQLAAARASDSLAGLLPSIDPADIHSFSYYNARGQMVAQVDGEGYLTEIVYDVNARVAQTIRYANKANGPVTASSTLAALRPKSNKEDHSSITTWDALGRLSTQTNAEGTVTSYTYDAVGNCTASTVAQGTEDQRTLLARYDVQGRVTAELSAVGAALLTGNQTTDQIEAIWKQYATTYTYDAAGRQTSSTDANGNRTAFFYDDAGRLRYTVNAAGEVSELKYDTLGHLTSKTQLATRLDAAALAALGGGVLSSASNQASAAALAAAEKASASNRTTAYAYDALGEMVKTTDALGAVSTSAYDAFGEVVRSTQALSGAQARVDTASYDRRGLETSSVADAGDASHLNVQTSAEYDAFGRLVRSVDANGGGSREQYDRLGRVVQVVDPTNAQRMSTYDAFDRVLSQTDALGNSTRYQYDTAGRSVTQTTPEGVQVTTTHTRNGQTRSIVDGNGNKTTYSYDQDGNLLRTETPLDGSTVVSTQSKYDATDRLVQTTDANGNLVAYVYDAANRLLTRTVDPSGLALTTRYEYSAFGDAVRTTDANGVVTETTYDAKGEVVTQAVDPSGLNLVTRYAYDARGRILTVTSPGGTVTQNVYDALGRRTKTVVDPNGLALTQKFEYDANGNVVSGTDANGQVTRYVYDADNRLIYTVDAAGGVQKIEYDAEGRTVRTTAYSAPIRLSGLGKAVRASEIDARFRAAAPGQPDAVVRNVYDRDGRLTYTVDGEGGVTRLVYDGNGNVIERRTYANRIALGSWDPGTAPKVVEDAAHDLDVRTVYDALNRAIFTVDGTGAVVAQKYDGNGNVVERVAYAQRLPAGTSISAAGLSAAVSSIADAAHDAHIRRVYDAANRLTWSVDGTGAVTQQVFDNDGNLVKEIAYSNTVGAGVDPRQVVASGADRVNVNAFDHASRLVYSVDALGGVMQHVYDQNGNVVQRIAFATRIPAPTASAAAPGVEAIASALGAAGALSGERRVTSSVYDSVNRQVFGVDAGGAVTEYRYDGVGHLIASTAYAQTIAAGSAPVVDASGVVTGRPAANAADRTTLNAYDGAGRLVYAVDALGYVQQTSYDGTGRATSHTLYAKATSGLAPGATGSQIANAVVASSADQTESFAYDAMGNVVGDVDALGQAEAFGYNGGRGWLRDQIRARHFRRCDSPQALRPSG